VKTFVAAFLGAFFGAGIIVTATAQYLAPVIGLTTAAAEKTLGPAEAERLVREKLGREWHAGQ
jgi:hypothetical protein